MPDLLRAARCLLGYTQTGIEKLLELNFRSVYTLEARRYKLMPRHVYLLKEKYELDGVEFTREADGFGEGVRWKIPGKKDPFKRLLFPAARGLANLSQADLGEVAGVDRSFIARFERDDFEYINTEKLQRLEAALRDKNVELTEETAQCGAGVRWIKQPGQ